MEQNQIFPEIELNMPPLVIVSASWSTYTPATQHGNKQQNLFNTLHLYIRVYKCSVVLNMRFHIL